VGVVEKRAALDRAIARWNAGDLDGYLDLYGESIKLHGYSPEPMDKAAVRGFYEGIHAAFPDPPLAIHDVFGSDEQLCCRFTMGGLHRGEFMGVPATGREISLDGITVLRFENAKCVERWSQADLLGLLTQLGALPPPG
jgi:steroid delta-isomerase-like uncharacterized protein